MLPEIEFQAFVHCPESDMIQRNQQFFKFGAVVFQYKMIPAFIFGHPFIHVLKWYYQYIRFLYGLSHDPAGLPAGGAYHRQGAGFARPGRARRLYLVPFTGEPVPESQWSLILDGTELDRQPVWSPSGDIIYFLSDRDGTRCIWAQRVDTATRKPVGEAFAALHIHQLRYYLNDVGDPASVGLTVVNGQMYFAGFEIQSNVWMAERREGAP